MLKYCNSNVVNISEYCEDENIKKTLELSAIVRCKTLDYCYSIENYENMSVEEKNKTYDKAREQYARIYGIKI